MKKKFKLQIVFIFAILFISTLFTSISVVKSYFETSEQSNDVTVYNTPIEFTPIDKMKLAEKIDVIFEEEEETVDYAQFDKVVYLTFDDGPSPLTNDFLDVLRNHDVPATFFMQGVNLKNEAWQQSVVRATEEGHYVGAHSMTHNYKQLYHQGQFVNEMKETIDLIQAITGRSPTLVRAPYGSAPGLNSQLIRDHLVDENIKLWDWTVDSKDWALTHAPAQILENIKNGTIRNREVVLFHEKPQTLAVLPEIIQFYKEKGYVFLVYDEKQHFPMNFQHDDRL